MHRIASEREAVLFSRPSATLLPSHCASLAGPSRSRGHGRPGSTEENCLPHLRLGYHSDGDLRTEKVFSSSNTSKIKMVIKDLPWKCANQYLVRTNALQNAVANGPPHSTALQRGSLTTRFLLLLSSAPRLNFIHYYAISYILPEDEVLP